VIWRSTAQILAAFLVAWLAVWFGPDLLIPLGLGEFVFIGQLCLVILALSLLEAVFRRIAPPRGTSSTGSTPSAPG
jgi:hypothetical protein